MPANNEYMAKYTLDRYHRRRSEAISKLGGKCKECGSEERLEIDHLEPAENNKSRIPLFSLSEIDFQNELKTCQILCKECHKKKTSKERRVEHGGGLSGKRNCPCELCRAKKNAYMKEKNYKKRSKNKIKGLLDF